ncbi:MAG: ADP-ribosylglycohydrolase family protein [Planctomycetota bacterium]
MTKTDLVSKFMGGMIGSAVGDAIGEIAFQHRSADALLREVQQTRPLIYTDDTAMAIGIAESLIERGELDHQHLGDTLRRNYEREPWRGYAMNPPTIFNICRQTGVSYLQAARSAFGGIGSYGNGAAMRITPIGLFYYDAEDIRPPAAASAQVTHTHPLGIEGAVLLACAIAQAVRLDPEKDFPEKDFLWRLRDIAETPEFESKIALMEDLLADRADAATAARELGTDVTAVGSVPFAIYSFLMHPKSFKDCLLHAVVVPGDSDTLGAMACAISGAYLGIEAVPQDWVDRLENREHIETLARRLAEIKKEEAGM